ncbi:MAG: hypothetical protein LBE13_13770 [Bacteroidales bacterium]|jgi:hypothetical protein|nr:hypothetical protein [Bacteroidales bacterium]
MKYHWYAVNWKNNFPNIAKAIKNNLYNDERTKGFVLEQTRHDMIKGIYYRKNTYDVISKDPHGNEIINNNIKYDAIKFCLSNSSTGVEIINPPRSSIFFFNELSYFSDFNVVIKKLNIDVLDLIHRIESTLTLLYITKIVLSDIHLSEGVTENLVISGKQDVRKYLADLKQYNLKKIQISYQNNNNIFKSEINSNGYIISDDRDKEFVIDIAREYLKETYTDR